MPSMIDLAEGLQNMIRQWITDSVESGLDKAIQESVYNDYFQESDVRHAIDQLKKSVLNNELVTWTVKVCEQNQHALKAISTDISNRNILCLHAGNLPMVGLQDALAVLLSGAQYNGKISRKDPFLLPSLLEFIKNNSTDFSIKFSNNILDFKNNKIQEWMFAGSESSLNDLKSTLESDLIIHPNRQRSLIRIAHFSVAKIDRWNDQICIDLIDSMFRYNGKGCRSVGMVFSKYKLMELADHLKEASSQWIRKNVYPDEPSPRIKLRSAYNDALGINQILVGNKLIQEGIASLDDVDIVYWQPETDINTINSLFGHHLQQIYLADQIPTKQSNLHVNNKCDFLHHAQSPPIWWQPDGIDVLKWIMDK